MAKVFNNDSRSWDSVETNLLCAKFDRNIESSKRFSSCELYIEASARTHSMTIMEIEKTGFEPYDL